jgi:hypothetical protein
VGVTHWSSELLAALLEISNVDGVQLTGFHHQHGDHRTEAAPPLAHSGRGPHPRRRAGLSNLPLRDAAQNRILAGDRTDRARPTGLDAAARALIAASQTPED